MTLLYRAPGHKTPYCAAWSNTLPADIQEMDAALVLTFQREHPWGLDTAVDLFGCDPAVIRDPATIRAWSIELCSQIHMRRYGEAQLIHFGEEPRVSGYTLVQLIETSAITAHFIEQADAVCLNIFSCSTYPPCRTAALCQQWFRAEAVRVSVVFRGPGQGGQISGEEPPPEPSR